MADKFIESTPRSAEESKESSTHVEASRWADDLDNTANTLARTAAGQVQSNANVDRGSDDWLKSLPVIEGSDGSKTYTVPMHVMTNRAVGGEKSGYLGADNDLAPVRYYNVPVEITVSKNYPQDDLTPKETKVDWDKIKYFDNVDDFSADLKNSENGSKASTNIYVHGVFTAGEDAIVGGAGISVSSASPGIVVDWAAHPVSSAANKDAAAQAAKSLTPEQQLQLANMTFLQDVENAKKSVEEMRAPLDTLVAKLGANKVNMEGYSEGGRFVLNYLDRRENDHGAQVGTIYLSHPEVESDFLGSHPSDCAQFNQIYVVGNMADQTLNTGQRFAYQGLLGLAGTDNYAMGNLPFSETNGKPWENSCQNMLAIDDSSQNLQAYLRGQKTFHFIDQALAGTLLRFDKTPDAFDLKAIPGRNRALLQYK
jgi:pimeloyl-ACP methyl ester carboxylesterase